MPTEPLTVEPGPWALHPCGWAASRDRNGTRLAINASVSAPRVVIRAQRPPDHPYKNATVEVNDWPTTADLLAGAELVLRVRRYGGLDLLLQESLAAGLPVVVSSDSPYAHDLMAESLVPAIFQESVAMKGGDFMLSAPPAEAIARRIVQLQNDAGLRVAMSEHSRKWADAHSWDALRGAWTEVLYG